MIERGNAHEYPGFDRQIVRASRVEATRHLECPSAGSPARGAPHVSAIARILTGNHNSGYDRALWDQSIVLGRIGTKSSSDRNQRTASLSLCSGSRSTRPIAAFMASTDAGSRRGTTPSA